MKLVTPKQAQTVFNAVEPMHDYLKRIHEKMREAGYFDDHPLVAHVSKTRDSMWAMLGELQYLARYRTTH